MTTPLSEKSWWGRTFGRSVLEMIVGIKFFEKKSNAASLIAILLVASICYVIVAKEKYEYMSFLLNIILLLLATILEPSKRK